MKNELIPLEKNNIFSKIKNIFRKLFSKKENSIINEENKNINSENANFNDNLKVDIDNSKIYNSIEKEKFIKSIKEDDTILDKLSLDRFRILEKYYEKKVQEKEKFLKKLNENN